MSPARTSIVRRPKKVGCTSNSNMKQRIPLSEELKHYLRISPYVSVPNIIVTPVLKEGKHVYDKNNPLVKLPVSKNSVLNGFFAKPVDEPPKDIRDDETKKGTFLEALNLVDKDKAERISANRDSYKVNPDLLQKLKSRKGQAASYFKNNPVPISSGLGKRIIDSGIGKCVNPKDEIERYERQCKNHKLRNISNNLDDWPQVNTRRAKLKPDQYVHKYTYGRRQRTTRQVELTVGVSSKSFPLLNSCREVNVKLYRMTDTDVAKEMHNLQKAQSLRFKQRVEQYRWIASEPIPGPSTGIERIAEPVVLLVDILHSTNTDNYFR